MVVVPPDHDTGTVEGPWVLWLLWDKITSVLIRYQVLPLCWPLAKPRYLLGPSALGALGVEEQVIGHQLKCEAARACAQGEAWSHGTSLRRRAQFFHLPPSSLCCRSSHMIYWWFHVLPGQLASPQVPPVLPTASFLDWPCTAGLLPVPTEPAC